MRRAQDPGSFSFELSESAPPVHSDEQTPMGELDLDLNDFGPGFELSSRAPEVAPDPNQEQRDEPTVEICSFSSPFSPLSPETVERLETAKRREQCDAPSEPHRDIDGDEPVFHFAPAQLPESPPPVEQERAKTKDQHPSTEKEQVKAEKEHPPTGQRSHEPKIKKIQFPARPTKAARPTTRFSSSISQRAPEVDRDSESSAFQAQGNKATAQAIPEDLEEARPPSGSNHPQGQWDSETPTAREIWHNARRVWQTTSRHAVTWGGQGLKSAHKFARNVNHKFHARLEEAADERKRKWEERLSVQHDNVPPTDDAPVDSPQATSAFLDCEPGAVSHTQPPPRRPRSPSPASLALLGLARTSLKKAAAPVSAIAAASLVYLGGTHLLGVEGALSLSKSTAYDGPAVPDLGTLEGQAPARKKMFDGAAKQIDAKKSAPAVPPMQTEQTKMPEGLSWPGKGLIEVVTSEDELIYIDGVFTGRGPLRRVPVTPGSHTVMIKSGGKQRTGTVEVSADKNTRAVFKGKNAP